MSLHWGTVSTIFRNDLRMLLRDRRTIVTAIILPLVMLPLILLSVSFTQKKREQRLSTATFRFAVSEPATELVRQLLVEVGLLTNSANLHFQRLEFEDPRTALSENKVEFIIETRLPLENSTEAESDSGTGAESGGVHGTPELRLVFRADREESTAGAHRMRELLGKVRTLERERLLHDAGLQIPLSEIAKLHSMNVAPEGLVAGLTLGRFLPLLLLLFLLTGGAVVATDLVAGEKERGTLETLLTSAARLHEIAGAKILVIFVVALTICSIQALNLLVYVGFALIPVPPHFAAAVPFPVAALLLALFLPIAALVSGILLLTSGYSRSYKEAQLYFLPVFLLGLLPALAPMLPGIPLRSAIVVVPIANLAVAVKEVLIGTFDWPMIALAWLSTAAAALWTVHATIRLLGQERLVTAADVDVTEHRGGSELFQRHVLGWFALLWALLILINNYTSEADIRLQLVINLLALFLGTTLFLLTRYRLDPRSALALRLPRPMVWAAVLLFAPCAMLTGTGLFRFADQFLPMPPEMIRMFSEAILPPHIPLLQVLFFLAVLPGIVEELTFRGLLLHGLHRRLHPGTLVVVVGLAFGLFHVALFRVLPTAWLGMLFAILTLLTGSVYPAMLAHILNNGLALLAGSQDMPISELEPEYYLMAAGGLAVAFWVLWRHRSPYPGLRPWRSGKRSD